MMSLHEAAALLQRAGITAQLRPADAVHEHVRFSGVSTDTRTIGPGELFVALVGENFDGHRFVGAARGRGAAAAIVSTAAFDAADAAGLEDFPRIVVADTRIALGALARGWRQRFEIPLVAVTGSNGKTTTKEMIAAILAREFGADNCLATEGNQNNDIGVPLTLLRLRTHHRAAVVELGMNHPGETAWLASLAQPTVALVTNAHREHMEFMENVEAVAAEHALAIAALAPGGVAVFPADDARARVWRETALASAGPENPPRRIVDFSTVLAAGSTGAVGSATTPPASAVVARAYLEADSSVVHLETPLDATTVRLQAPGLHNARNAAAAAAAAVAVDVLLSSIHRGLEDFVPVTGRTQRRATAGGVQLIDDSYNANPDSMRAAIDLLAACGAPALLIVGDMGEVGHGGPRFHAEIGEYARDRGIATLLATGALMREAVAAFGAGARHFEDIGDLVAAAQAALAPGEVRAVLVKGSRFMRMERIADALCMPPAGSSDSLPAETH